LGKEENNVVGVGYIHPTKEVGDVVLRIGIAVVKDYVEVAFINGTVCTFIWVI